jgi:hypothetical protein
MGRVESKIRSAFFGQPQATTASADLSCVFAAAQPPTSAAVLCRRQIA